MNKKSIVFVNQSSGYLMIDIIHAVGKHSTKSMLIAGGHQSNIAATNTSRPGKSAITTIGYAIDRELVAALLK
jgi:hypothetical protein